MHISNKCSIAVHCLVYIHQFSASRKVTSELLSISTGSNPVTVRTIMSALRRNGLISVQPGTGGAALSCAPEEISLCRIVKAVEPDALNKLMGIHKHPSADCPVGSSIHEVLNRSYARIRSSLEEDLSQVTLRDVLGHYEAVTG